MQKIAKIVLNLFSNPTLSTWFYTGSRILILLGITPLVVSRFTVGEIGLWYLLVSIQGFAHLFDIGFSTTIIRYAAYTNAVEKIKQIEQLKILYNSMNTIFSVLTLISFIFIILFGYFSVIPLIESNNIENGLISFIVICIFFPINFFFKKNDAFIKGLNFVSLFNNWNAIIYLVGGSLTILTLAFKLPFYLVFASHQTTIFANTIKNIFLFKKVTNSQVQLFKFSFDKNKVLELWKPTWKSAMISFSSNGITQLTNIFASKYLTIELAASYMFSMRLMNIINEFSWAPFYARLPMFIKDYKEGKLKTLAFKVYSKLNLSLVLLIFGLTGLVLFSSDLLNLINSNVGFIDHTVAGLIILMLVLDRLMAMHSQVIMFSNNIEHYKIYVSMSLLYIGSLWIAIQIFGIIAIPVIFITLIIIPLILITRRSLNQLIISAQAYVVKYGIVIIVSLLVVFLSLIII